jgi:hypothetical protein
VPYVSSFSCGMDLKRKERVLPNRASIFSLYFFPCSCDFFLVHIFGTVVGMSLMVGFPEMFGTVVSGCQCWYSPT